MDDERIEARPAHLHARVIGQAQVEHPPPLLPAIARTPLDELLPGELHRLVVFL